MRTAIVVPTYNRPEALAACLEALGRLDPAPDEIVVVDDGGARPAAEVCARFDGRVRCIRQANAGPAAARNAGVRATGADLVALTDDDCAPRPDWLGALVRAQGGVRGRMVGGRVENALSSNVYAAASQALCDYLYVAGGAERGRRGVLHHQQRGLRPRHLRGDRRLRRELSARRRRGPRPRPALAGGGRHAGL